MTEAWVVWTVAGVFGAAAAAPIVCRTMGPKAGWFLGLVPLVSFLGYLLYLPVVMSGGAANWEWAWVEELGIRLSFRVDGLSLLFLLVVSLVGTFVTWHAGGYLKCDPRIGGFYFALLSFMGAMLGLVAADNLILLFIFWELTSITSYLLIGHYREEEASRKSALQALLVTGGGGLALMAGLILLGGLAGTFEVSRINALPEGALVGKPGFGWALGLILVGAFTKSAQFPFHFWLPNAMAAPAPVSAFLHSATMVKAGVFLLARLCPALSQSVYWTPVLTGAGAATMVVGVALALGQRDLKKLLAYTTLAVLGTLTLLLGIGTVLAVKAAMAYLLAHALYKAALFMVAGNVDHETGTRDVTSLGGLRHVMPWSALAALLAGLSMAGLPFLLGFVSKEYFYKALLDAPGFPGLWEALGVSVSVGLVAMAGVAGIQPFYGRLVQTPKKPHEAPVGMWLGPLVLGVAAIKFGILPGMVGDAVLIPAAGAVLGDTSLSYSLKLWHGWTVALGLSALTLALGILVYWHRDACRRAAWHLQRLGNIGPEAGYGALLQGVLDYSLRLTKGLQSGYLRNYLLIVCGFFILLIAMRLPENLAETASRMLTPTGLLPLVVCSVTIVSGIFACLATSRFVAIMALGAAGLCIAMLYFLFQAPDLAMTQILVETLTLVLFVAAFHRLPLLRDYSSLGTRLRDAVFACGFGIVMALLVLAATQFWPGFEQPAGRVSDFMGEASLPLARGRNVVNVILVDFRALDTLGEIAVIAIAALGVYAMLKMKLDRGSE